MSDNASDQVALSDLAAPIREYLTERTDVTRPSFNATALAHHLAPAVERIVRKRLAEQEAARLTRVEERVNEIKAQALLDEADLIGNGTCCPECDGVAEMMRERAGFFRGVGGQD